MKIVDDNGKIFGKINLVDLGVVLLLVLAVAAVGYKVVRERFIERETVNIEYTILVEGVREQSVNAIGKVSEKIEDAENGDVLGDIIDIKKENASDIVQKADGEYVKTVYPDKYDLHITLRTEGISSKDGYCTFSGKKILYGDTIGINNGYSQMFGIVEDIQITETEQKSNE